MVSGWWLCSTTKCLGRNGSLADRGTVVVVHMMVTAAAAVSDTPRPRIILVRGSESNRACLVSGQ